MQDATPPPVHLSLRRWSGVSGWLVIDMPNAIISRLQGTQICCHCRFSPRGMRLLILLLLFSECCPTVYLVAALRCSDAVLLALLTLPPADPAARTFFDEAERLSALLHTPGKQREQYRHQLHKAMTEAMKTETRRLGFEIVPLRGIGYRLQVVQTPQLPKRKQSKREEWWNDQPSALVAP